MARHWEEEVSELSDEGLRTALLKRLESFRTCGKAVQVRRCGGCGTDRPGSGTFRGTRTCKTRACPVCSKLRSESYSDWVDLAWATLPQVEGYSWRWLTLTTKYDPTSDDDCSWEALQVRARACAKSSTRVWDRFLSMHPGAGAFRTIEVGKRGHVHANIVYYGPELDTAKVEAAVAKVSTVMGHVFATKVSRNVVGKKGKRPTQQRDDEFEEDEDKRGSLDGLRRVAKYVSKGLTHETRTTDLHDEDWVTGEKSVTTCDPRLAARWEIATYRMHLVQRYGSLRGLELDEHGCSKPDNTNDSGVKCGRCGKVGFWKTGFRSTADWFVECHDRGERALHSTAPEWKSVGWDPVPE